MYLRRRYNHREHCSATSRHLPPLHQISDDIPVISSSFAGHSFPNWFESRFSIWLDSILVLIWLESLVFYLIQTTPNVFIFDLSHAIRITLQSGFRVSHIGQGALEIFQHWNCGIFHNSYNWIWGFLEHSNREKKKFIRVKEKSSGNPIMLTK